MDELLLRYLRGQTTDEENRSVRASLGESPGAGQELNDLRMLVEAGRIADLEVEPGDPPAAREVIWTAEARRAAAARRRSERHVRPRRASSRLGLFAGWATAAAAAVAALLIWDAQDRSGSGTGRDGLAAQEFITAPGETALVRLGDGSVIRLGPASRLTMPAGASARAVALEGEGFFSIATDPAHPFRVTTAAGTARVLGTRFHLAAQLAELRLLVVEGTVALGTATEEVQVGAGQAASLIEGRPGPILAAPPIEEAASWLDGFLIFQDTPLALAIREVEQRYGADVEVEEPVLLQRTLTMWFTSKSLEEVMTVICNVVDAQCSIADGAVRMRSRNSDGSR
jgi:transmembrane sensor